LETGQRGYLLSGERAYLEPYQQAKLTIPGWIDSLQAVVVRPDQVDRVKRMRTLILDKVSEVDSTLLLREQSGEAATLEMIRTDRGRVTMDAIRRLSAEIANVSYALLLTNSASFET